TPTEYRKQAKEMGYETVFTYVDINDPESYFQIKNIVQDSSAAVVLLGTEMMEEDFQLFENAKCHIILLDGWSDTYFFDAVLISNTDAACRAVEYLIQKGHEKIGYIGGDFRIQAFKYREIGYRRMMEKYNLPIENKYRILVGTKIDTAYEKMKDYLSRDREMPTAFFVDNDTIAIGVMRALQEKGYKIPEDISIVGFDDLNFGLVSNPPLTTVHVYKREMGEIAVRELAEAMNNKNKMKCKIQVCTEFVERGSVKTMK
ncbi:MAG: substrate-binding domain-containing protein, partial [Clostridiaceae bacterium]|nr:substrate-binding domain-containing protein [Clostridiaceae bacterium]